MVKTPPKATAGDVVYGVVRGTTSTVPVVGNLAAEFLQMIVAPPLEKRRYEWCESVVESIQRLAHQQKCVVEELSNNTAFIDTILQAAQSAVRTSQHEKHDALRNAVLNAALPNAPDDSWRQIFIGWVDTLTVWHLRMLSLFADPSGWYHRNSRQPPQYGITSSLSALLTNAYPELQNQPTLYDKLAKDLHNEGLLATDGLHTSMSAEGAFRVSTTELGTKFLRFITDPLTE